MKKIRKSECPDLLRCYIADYPDNTWEELKNETDVHEAICQLLMMDQGGLCAYCEVDLLRNPLVGLGDFRVEHFHPKSESQHGSINHALRWDNLLAVCHGGSQAYLAELIKDRHTSPDHSCDVPKGNQNLVGIIFDPQDIPALEPIFDFDRNGNDAGIMKVRENCPEELKEQANKSIEKLRLNADRLKFARGTVLDKLQEQINEFFLSGMDLQTAQEELAMAYLRKDKNNCWPAFFTCIRSFLEDAGEAQLHKIGFEG